MKSAAAGGTLVAAQNQGSSEAVLGAIRDVVTKFMNSNQDAASAAAALARAVKAAMT